MEEIEIIGKLLSALSPDSQQELIKALKSICKQALTVSDDLGTKGIEAAERAINHSFDSVQESINRISDNSANCRINQQNRDAEVKVIELIINGRIQELQSTTLKDLCNSFIKSDNPDHALLLFQSHLDAELKKKKEDEKAKNEVRLEAIRTIKGLADDILDAYIPIRLLFKSNREKALRDAYKLSQDIRGSFPEDQYPQLAQACRLMDKCVAKNDAGLIQSAMEIVKEEADTIEKGLIATV